MDGFQSSLPLDINAYRITTKGSFVLKHDSLSACPLDRDIKMDMADKEHYKYPTSSASTFMRIVHSYGKLALFSVQLLSCSVFFNLFLNSE